MIQFPISGVETWWWLPPLVAFAIACFSSMGGVSGAFLIMPFQISVLGFTSPGASATNLLYNVIAIPSGVWRYWRERRIVWPLAGMLVLGIVPATLLGVVIRLRYLSGGKSFKGFVGFVLLYIAARLVFSLFRPAKSGNTAAKNRAFEIETKSFGLRRLEYSFDGAVYSVTTWKLFAILAVFGVIAGAYGIGGGAIVAPFLVAMFRLPVHSIAGATLFSTFVASVSGVGMYWLLAPALGGGEPASPDWLLGLLLGLGGAAGVYCGARLQRYVSDRAISLILTGMTVFIAVKYIVEAFR